MTAGRQSLSSWLIIMRCAINMAWDHGGADFQSRFDKSTAQAEQMKEGGAAGSVNSLVIQFFKLAR